jgi:transcriptional regulator with XRE-family HTH domain
MAPSDQPQPALGKAIRELREKQEMTQESVAHDAGITTATLGVIERGVSNPTWATLRGIAFGARYVDGRSGTAGRKARVANPRLAQKETEKRHPQAGTPRNRPAAAGTPISPWTADPALEKEIPGLRRHTEECARLDSNQ